MRKKLRNSKRNSSLIEKTIESYPFLKEIYKPSKFNMFKADSADFSAESFFDLVLDFLVMYIVLLYSVTVCLKSGLLKNSNKQFSTYCFLNDDTISDFYKFSKEIEQYIGYYKNTKNNFNKDIYLTKINYLFNKLTSVFNLLSEYIGSFSNTYLYRNITINNRVLSIIDPAMNENLLLIIEFSHHIILKFFTNFYNSFLKFYDLEDHVYGFVGKKSCFHNATYHLNNKPESLINIDVNKFFNNCTIIKLINSNVFIKTLSNFDMRDSILKSFYFGIISLFCYLTHNSVFPTGASYTPVLSNLIFLFIDVEIKDYICSLNKKYGNNINIQYSRYADDITLSSNYQRINNINTLNITVIKHIENILNKYGFFLKYDKTKFFLKGDAKVVNGLILDIPNNKLSIGTDLKYELKNKLRNNPDALLTDKSYAGYISYVKGVSKKQYDYIIANDLFPNVDQRLAMFVKKFKPFAKQLIITLTCYEADRFYITKRVDAEEVLTMKAWNWGMTRYALSEVLPETLSNLPVSFPAQTEPYLFANGRDVYKIVV